MSLTSKDHRSVFFSVLIVVAILGVLSSPIVAITKAIAVSSDFFSMIDSTSVSHDGLSEPDVSSHDDIEFHEVSFTYPTRPEVQILKEFSATFLKGKTTALVGPSGSGKSTIVALLERWYSLGMETEDEEDKSHKENHGAILIGGCDIALTNLKWWRSQIGLVQQEPFLFNDTILNNVAFGLLGTEWEKENEATKRERVEKACKEAFADEFIQQLPDVSTIDCQIHSR